MRGMAGNYNINRDISGQGRDCIFWRNPTLKAVYVDLCSWSNYADTESLKFGQVITSYQELSENNKITYAQARNHIKILILHNFINKLPYRYGLMLEMIRLIEYHSQMTAKSQPGSQPNDSLNPYNPNGLGHVGDSQMTDYLTARSQPNDNIRNKEKGIKEKETTTTTTTESNLYNDQRNYPSLSVVSCVENNIDNFHWSPDSIDTLKNCGIVKTEDIEMIAKTVQSQNITSDQFRRVLYDFSKKIEKGERINYPAKYLSSWLERSNREPIPFKGPKLAREEPKLVEAIPEHPPIGLEGLELRKWFEKYKPDFLPGWDRESKLYYSRYGKYADDYYPNEEYYEEWKRNKEKSKEESLWELKEN